MQFIQDGKEELLTHTVHITIAPMAAVDSSFTPSRRPSLVGDIHNPRRIMSDSIVNGVPPPQANAQRYAAVFHSLLPFDVLNNRASGCFVPADLPRQ